jgi:hypothetical protein
MEKDIRFRNMTSVLDLNKVGLEISPLYRPTVRKQDFDVYYTDYCSADESRKKHSEYDHDEIMEIDFIWAPGKRLKDCVSKELCFDWAISSHVMEHVPNPIGWLLEVFEVLNEGAIFSIALPDMRHCYDKFRRETDAADLIDVWIRKQSIPSPYQLFDFLTRSVDGDGRSFNSYHEANRRYSDDQALCFVMQSWVSGEYFDVHCSAFTPESFVKVFSQLNDLGILNIEISEPVEGCDEFFVKLKKLGEPSIIAPSAPHSNAAFVSSTSHSDLYHAHKAFEQSVVIQNELKRDLNHARKAFEQSVVIQNELKSELQRYRAIKARIPNWLRSIAREMGF